MLREKIVYRPMTRFSKSIIINVTIGLSVLGITTSCMMANPVRRVAHADVTVLIPKTWHEISLPKSEGFEGFIVARAHGTASLTVERLPGSFERHLQLCHGFKFTHDNGSGETIIFIPSSDLDGWYILGVVSNVEKGAKREFNDVLKSLKKSMPDEKSLSEVSDPRKR
jgi:hypothetical protein